MHSKKLGHQQLWRVNRKLAVRLWGEALTSAHLQGLKELSRQFGFSVALSDVLLLDGRWYVTHAGLLRLAGRHNCSGIRVHPVREFCDPDNSRWAFKATVYKNHTCKGFAGYGDADSANVSPVIRGAEMRMAETRAVNRALRKAYGIGICSVEEIGSLAARSQREHNVRKLPPQPVDRDGAPTLRDQLCLLIRQHRLDAFQVKQYAADFCGTDDIRKANREQIQSFITHLAELATKDHDTLLCKLNSYGSKPEAGAA
jgi:hypothetical protein